VNIILGVTGSVAAYKTPWLVRDLRKAGHDVRVIMTPSARAFVAPLALEAASAQRVIIEQYDPEIQEGGSWHVHLAKWADVLLIAPCSASTLSKIANGQCDNALLTVTFSLPPTTPLIVAPAMDSDMWMHAATQRNVQTLRKDGVEIIQPVDGPLASGLTGPGRLPEIENIVAIVSEHQIGFKQQALGVKLQVSGDRLQASGFKPLEENLKPNTYSLKPDAYRFALSGLHVVITAGPTHERIDAVRSIVNQSTGTMGFALAAAARDRGMNVTLIAGPVHLPTPLGVERIDVTTAAEMMSAVRSTMHADVFVMAAAVADYTPKNPADGKIKKTSAEGEGLTLELQRTEDILAYIGSHHTAKQTVVGFALEYDNVVGYAIEKLAKKNADIIVANQAGVPDSGFGTKNNTITIIQKPLTIDPLTVDPLTIDPLTIDYPPMNKRACAEVILDHIADVVANKTGHE